MALIWTGILLLILRWLDVQPVAAWPAAVLVIPFAAASLWFGVVERTGQQWALRFPRRRDDGLGQARRRRIDVVFADIVVRPLDTRARTTAVESPLSAGSYSSAERNGPSVERKDRQDLTAFRASTDFIQRQTVS